MHAVKTLRQTVTLCSEAHIQVIDITKQIQESVLGADVHDGILIANSLHTTCALLVNEFQGALVDDLQTMLARLVPDAPGYEHDDPRYSDCERGTRPRICARHFLGAASRWGSAAGSWRSAGSNPSCSPSWTDLDRAPSMSR